MCNKVKYKEKDKNEGSVEMEEEKKEIGRKD